MEGPLSDLGDVFEGSEGTVKPYDAEQKRITLTVEIDGPSTSDRIHLARAKARWVGEEDVKATDAGRTNVVNLEFGVLKPPESQ